MRITVIFADTLATEHSIVHECEHRPYRRRIVQIELTPEQMDALTPREVGHRHGLLVHEEILQCWIEPEESKG